MMIKTSGGFVALRADSGAPVTLAMQRLWMTGEILPAGARLRVRHEFCSAGKRPLEAIYAFVLPRDAALHSFLITGEGFDVRSALRPTEEAAALYENGIAAGALAALARQYGDGYVNLTTGNIRPGETVTVELDIIAGVELRDDGFRFRFPFTLAPVYHSQARIAVTTGGEGEVELPADVFGDVLLPPFRKDASGLHEVGFDVLVTGGATIAEIGSPSHAVRLRPTAPEQYRVSLAPEKDVPDRDLVLDVRFESARPRVLAGGKQFAAVVPSSSFEGRRGETPRRIVILLDRSGSMAGGSIERAKKAIEACLALLSDTDEFSIIAFDDKLEKLSRKLLHGDAGIRNSIREFLSGIDARGGTELGVGIRAAADLLGNGGGDILILTDGQVSGTEEILALARAAGARLHCLGIGSASQDRFLSLLARETGGVSRFVTPSERVDLSAVDLFASIGAPIATGVAAEHGVEPQPPAYVMAGTPVVLFGESDADTIRVTWDAGSLEVPIARRDDRISETLRLLRGARLITNWDSRYPAQEANAPLDKRRQSRIAARLRELSERYGLASREMSLVAVVHRSGDKAGDLPDTQVIPVGLPKDMEFESYFRGPGPFLQMFAGPLIDAGMPQASPPKVRGVRKARAAAATEDDRLVELAALIEPDGGMPGKTSEERAAATLAAVFAFMSHGHTLVEGAFRAHVRKLWRFLDGSDAEWRSKVDAALQLARSGQVPEGDWLTWATDPGAALRSVSRAIADHAKDGR